LPERLEVATVPPPAVAPGPTKPLLFAGITDDALLGYGVPTDWLGAVRRADEASLFDMADRLPQEAAEALLDLATGTNPEKSAPAPPAADPFAHPDAQRRFRVLTNVAELERALDYPWEKWAVFLHPTQRATMHLAKGLEFRAVVVMACDDEVIPLQERIEAVADDADLEDVYNTERHLLYVACTRARDHLIVTGVAPGSEFLEDLAGK
jgi:superfamily I DNA/RNA helicase